MHQALLVLALYETDVQSKDKVCLVRGTHPAA